MTPRLGSRLAVAPLLGVVACANVWGFQDLREGPDGGASDATTGGDDRGEADGRSSDDASGGQVDATSEDARGDAQGPEAGEAGPIGEDGSLDAANDGPTAAQCQSLCGGCWDANNHCQATTSPTACGKQGSACVNCKQTTTCTLAATCCVSGGCGCVPIACP